jgi:hypothetical protein
MSLGVVDWVIVFALVFLVSSLIMGVVKSFKDNDKIEGFYQIGWTAFVLICTARFFYQEPAVYKVVNAFWGQIVPVIFFGILIGIDVALIAITLILGLHRKNAAKEKFVWHEPHVDDVDR